MISSSNAMNTTNTLSEGYPLPESFGVSYVFWRDAAEGLICLQGHQLKLVNMVRQARGAGIKSVHQIARLINLKYPDFLPVSAVNGANEATYQTEITGACNFIAKEGETAQNIEAKALLAHTVGGKGALIGTITPDEGSQLYDCTITEISSEGIYQLFGHRGRNKQHLYFSASGLVAAIKRGQPSSLLTKNLCNDCIN